MPSVRCNRTLLGCITLVIPAVDEPGGAAIKTQAKSIITTYGKVVIRICKCFAEPETNTECIGINSATIGSEVGLVAAEAFIE